MHSLGSLEIQVFGRQEALSGSKGPYSSAVEVFNSLWVTSARLDPCMYFTPTQTSTWQPVQTIHGAGVGNGSGGADFIN